MIDQLLNVYGIGPAKAKTLIETNKVKSIEDLKNKSDKDDKLLTRAQKIGLICYDDLLETENEDLFYAKLAYACIREDIYDNMDEFKNDLADYIKRQKLDELDEEEQEHNAIVLNNSNNF